MVLKLILCLVIMSAVYGEQEYQQRIPNGANVPDPFNTGNIWHGVGHRVAGGEGSRNPFGEAFEAAGEAWTVAFCQQDTDEDGETNGQELGDPDCLWTPGDTPARITDITHPGICEPITSTHCQEVNNRWLGQCGGDSSEECESGGSTVLTTSLLIVASSATLILIRKLFV